MFLIKAGIVNIPITASITGISRTRDALIPAIVFPIGTANGAIVTAIPLTRTKLNRFAPIRFPRDNAPFPFISEVIAVTSSGREVPRATNVREITVCGTPHCSAI